MYLILLNEKDWDPVFGGVEQSFPGTKEGDVLHLGKNRRNLTPGNFDCTAVAEGEVLIFFGNQGKFRQFLIDHEKFIEGIFVHPGRVDRPRSRDNFTRHLLEITAEVKDDRLFERLMSKTVGISVGGPFEEYHLELIQALLLFGESPFEAAELLESGLGRIRASYDELKKRIIPNILPHKAFMLQVAFNGEILLEKRAEILKDLKKWFRRGPNDFEDSEAKLLLADPAISEAAIKLAEFLASASVDDLNRPAPPPVVEFLRCLKVLMARSNSS